MVGKHSVFHENITKKRLFFFGINCSDDDPGVLDVVIFQGSVEVINTRCCQKRPSCLEMAASVFNPFHGTRQASGCCRFDSQQTLCGFRSLNLTAISVQFHKERKTLGIASIRTKLKKHPPSHRLRVCLQAPH